MNKIMSGLKLKGRPAEIPNCGREDLPEFFKELGLKVGVEIGVSEGYFSEKLCQAGLKVYGVDPWLKYSGFLDSQGNLDERYEVAVKRLKNYDCKLIRKMSMDAVKDFDDESLDFVYIDGHHAFKYVAEDLFEWHRKVRPGGVIAGHDYSLDKTPPYRAYACHVKYVVNAFTSAFGIRRWYVLGNKTPAEGEIRDRRRSYFWIK
jgi:SAM-dependent methyltransferase